MNIEEIKSEFEKDQPTATETLKEGLGERWHIEWTNEYPSNEHLSYCVGLWSGFLAGYVKAEKNLIKTTEQAESVTPELEEQPEISKD